MDVLSPVSVDFLDMDSTIRAIIFGGIFLVSLGVSLWVYYDSQGQENNPVAWRALVAIGTVGTLPALVVAAFNLDVDRQGLVNPLGHVALGGGALTLLTAVGYLIASRRRVQEVAYMPPLSPQPVVEDETIIQPRKPELTRIARLEEQKHLAFIVEKTGTHMGAIHALGERTIIGRDASLCDITTDDDLVSREHTSIRFQDDRFVVRDLDSSNGTWLLEGEREVNVEAPHVLREHDRFKVGHTVFAFTRVDDGVQPNRTSNLEEA